MFEHAAPVRRPDSRSDVPPPRRDVRADALLQLQRSAGNHAVSRMILARYPKVGGKELKTLDDVKAALPEVHTAFVAYCRARMVSEPEADGLAALSADDFLGDTDGELKAEQIQDGLEAKFGDYWGMQPANKKRDPNATPAAASAPSKPVGVLPTGPAPAQPFARNTRAGTGFTIEEVAPGVGVEVVGNNTTYADAIAGVIATMSQSQLGRDMLAQFDPRGGTRARIISTDANNPYHHITVLVGLPMAANDRYLIETVDVGPLTGPATRPTGGTTIPRIAFFAPPASENEAIKIGKADSTAFVTHKGIEKHTDFPDEPQNFDTVMFHEFGHAYLSQLEISKHLDNTQEEHLVVGLMGAKGLPMSENAYRCQRGYSMRKGYFDAKIPVDRDFPEKQGDARSFWSSLKPNDLVKAVMAVTRCDEPTAKKIVRF